MKTLAGVHGTIPYKLWAAGYLFIARLSKLVARGKGKTLPGWKKWNQTSHLQEDKQKIVRRELLKTEI